MRRTHRRYNHMVRARGGFNLASIVSLQPWHFNLARSDLYTTSDGNDINVNQWTGVPGTSVHLASGSSAAYYDYVYDAFGTGQDAFRADGVDNRAANTTDITGLSSNNAVTVIWRASMTSNGANQTFFEYTLNANINSGIQCLYITDGRVYFRLFSNGGNQAVLLTGQTLPYEGVFAMRADAATGKLTVWKDKVLLGEATGVGTFTNTWNRLYVGSPNSTQDFSGDYGAIMAFYKALTEEEIFNSCDVLAGGYSDITTDPSIIWEGDSLGDEPASGSKNPSYQAILAGEFPGWEMTNEHTPGDTMQNIATNYANVNALYKPRASRNVVCLLAGTNDIGSAGRTGAQVYADMQTAVTQWAATGYENFVCTVPDRSPDTYDTEIANYNALVRANDGSNYTMIDLANDAVFSYGSDTDYFYDGLHFEVAAHARAAVLIKAAIF